MELMPLDIRFINLEARLPFFLESLPFCCESVVVTESMEEIDIDRPKLGRCSPLAAGGKTRDCRSLPLALGLLENDVAGFSMVGDLAALGERESWTLALRESVLQLLPRSTDCRLLLLSRSPRPWDETVSASVTVEGDLNPLKAAEMDDR